MGPWRSILVILPWVAVLALVAWHQFPGLGGDTVNSDDAVPLIMANTDHISAYHYYYFGQDRFGGLPMIAMNLCRQALGGPWTYGQFYAVQVAFLMASITYFITRFQRTDIVAFGVFLPFLLPSSELAYFYRAQHVWSWTVGFLFLATGFLIAPQTWTAARVWRTGLIRLSHPSLGRWAGLTLLFYLAVWINLQNAAYLFVGIILAATYFWHHPGTPRTHVLSVVGSLALAVAIELLAKERYHASNLLHFGYTRRQETVEFTLQPKMIITNFLECARTFAQVDRFVLTLGGIITGLGLLTWSLRSLPDHRGRSPGRADATLLIGLLMGWILVCLATLSTSRWIRANAYHPRYQALLHVLGPALLLLAVGLVIDHLLKRRGGSEVARRMALSVGALLAVVGLTGITPGKTASFRAIWIKAIALEKILPSGALLIGEYWNSYVYNYFLQTFHTLSKEGDFRRQPWLIASLPTRDEVYLNIGVTPEFSNPDGSPKEIIKQFGVSFQFVEIVLNSNELLIGRYRRIDP